MFMPEVTAFCYIFGEKCGLRNRFRQESERIAASDTLASLYGSNWDQKAYIARKAQSEFVCHYIL